MRPYTTIPPLGYEIVSHCNLNCTHCCHFSQYNTPAEKSLEQIEQDITRLKIKLNKSNIPLLKFKISGGEPLLHSNICMVFILIRKILGNNIKISVLTNGIKLKSMDEHFFNTVKYLNIDVAIAKYPINVDYAAIEQNLKNRKISFSTIVVTEFGNVYKRIDPTGNQDAEKSFDYCKSMDDCPYYDGKFIHKCRFSQNVPYLNKKFNYDIKATYISIGEPVETILNYLNSPCIMCTYCIPKQVKVPWTRL